MIAWNGALWTGLALLTAAILGGIWSIARASFGKRVSTALLLCLVAGFLAGMLVILASQIQVISKMPSS